jgi:hypothetical protein
MTTKEDHMRFQRLFILLIGLILFLQVPGEPSHAAQLQSSSVSINMSNPTCVHILPTSGACSIQIGSLTASGNDQSFSRVEVLVNGKLRVYMSGFFESSAFLAYPMVSGGLIVACGRSNDGGLPNFGRAYLLTANAYMADGTSASSSMNVFCPAFEGVTYFPLILRK